MSYDPIAYTYEASEHCPACAQARFGRNERGFIAEGATDTEGNPVGAAFEPFEDRGMACGTCNAIISPTPRATDPRVAIAAEYRNDGTTITQPGKFQGLPLWAPHFLDRWNDGDETEVFPETHYGVTGDLADTAAFVLDAEDVRAFPELDGVYAVTVAVDEQGFVDARRVSTEVDFAALRQCYEAEAQERNDEEGRFCTACRADLIGNDPHSPECPLDATCALCGLGDPHPQSECPLRSEQMDNRAADEETL